MAKISKNAKKLLALTLAGVMTVGTAVPGTAMSTVQEAQAATTADAKEVLKTVEQVYAASTELQAGVYSYGDTYNIPGDLGDKLAAKSELEEIAKEWTITATGVKGTESNKDNLMDVGVKFTVTHKTESDVTAESAEAVSTGIDLYNAEKLAGEIGAIKDLNAAAENLELSATQTDVQNAAAEYVKDVLLKDNPAAGLYTITVTAESAAETTPQDGYAKTWKITEIKITDQNVASDMATVELDSDDTSDGVYMSWGTPEIDETDSEVLAFIQNYVSGGLEIPKSDPAHGVSLAPNTDGLSSINTFVEGKITTALKQNGNFESIADNYTYENQTIVSTGVWKADLMKSGYKVGTITVNLTKEGIADQTIVKLQLTDAKTELTSNDSAIEMAIPGITIWKADGTSETVPGNDGRFYYDKTAFDVSVLGHLSFEIKAKDEYSVPGENASVLYEADVVNNKTYETEKASLGNIEESNVESIMSDDEDVLKITKDSDDKYVLQGRNAGVANVTVTNKNGMSFTTKVTVPKASNGSYTYGPARLTAAASYVQNIPGVVGFTATSITSTSQTVDNWKDGDTVATAEIKDGKIKFAPVANGTAVFTVKGGDNGKLTTTITVTVNSGNSTAPVTIKFPNDQDVNDWSSVAGAALDLNRAATAALSETSVDDDDLGVWDAAKIFNDSSYKLLIKSTAEDQGIDSVPASEATKVELKKCEAVNTPVNGYEVGDYYFAVSYGTLQAPVYVKVDPKATFSFGKDELQLTPSTSDNVTLKLTNQSSATSDVFNYEVKADNNGIMKVYVIAGSQAEEGDTAELTVKDAMGNTAKAYIKFTNGTIVADISKGTDLDGYDECGKYEDYKLVGTKKVQSAGNVAANDDIRVYTLGDEVDYSGLTLEYDTASVAVTKDMVGDNYNAKTAYVTGDKLATQYASVSYGGFNTAKANTNNDQAIPFQVKPAFEQYAVSALGLAEEDTVTSVSYKGDATITAELSTDKNSIEITATKVEQSGAAIITTKNGNTMAVKINVGADGKITTSLTKDFSESVTALDNTEEVFGIIGTSVASSNTGVAVAEITADRIVITSVNPGTSVITVTDGKKTARFEVTVDAFGTITVGEIQKAVDNGWVRGEGSDWYYYINGEKVTNNWVAVEEADPYNNNEVGKVWYHFDKDGKMQRGWIKDETGWKIYNLDSNGRMRHDMWINAEANEELGMPTGIYHLLSDGAAQMNGWAESITEGIYWFCAPNSGVFDASNPANWATEMPK